MTEGEPSAGAWINRLARALAGLGVAQEPYLPSPPGEESGDAGSWADALLERAKAIEIAPGRALADLWFPDAEFELEKPVFEIETSDGPCLPDFFIRARRSGDALRPCTTGCRSCCPRRTATDGCSGPISSSARTRPRT